MDKIILIGAGGHARACIDVIEQEGRYEIAGLIDKENSIAETILGYHVLGLDSDLETIHLKYKHALVTVGQIKTPDIRIDLYNRLKSIGYFLPVIISPMAYMSKHSRCGDGTVVMHGAIVNAGARIGHNCIINNRALVDHDVTVGPHCHIATGAVLNGGVNIGEGTFIGSGAVIKQGVAIGRHGVIGAGCVIKKDVPDQMKIK